MQLKVIAVWTLIIIGGVAVVFSSMIVSSPSVEYVRGTDVNEHTDFLATRETDADTSVEGVTLPATGVSVAESVQTETIQTTEQTTSPERLIETPTNLVSSETSEAPTRLTIPKIGVNAAVVYVGIAPDGTMDIPKGPDDVAWFNLGPHPGDEGSAVISGHYGWKDNIPAVFDNLNTLQKGDKIYVKDGQGIITTFVVRETRVYDEYQDATDIFVSSDGKAHLNLITCGGIWDNYRKSYSQRTVVFTDKE